MSILDANSLSADTLKNIDVCIVGGGPAGLTVANELINSGLRVVLLECGNYDENLSYKALAAGRGESIGDKYPDARYTSVRRYGGMSHKWKIDMSGQQPEGAVQLISHDESEDEDKASRAVYRNGVRYVVLDDIDFEKRDWLPHSGWPITKSDLLPYYERAHALCQAGPFDYSVSHWSDANSKELATDPDVVTTQIFRFGPNTVFLQDIKVALEQSSTVDVILNATVVELDTDDAGQKIVSAHVKNLQGLDIRIDAREFVLAMGAAEIARVLFNSNRVHPNGLGNQSDMVGRFLMDHPVVRSGAIVPKDIEVLKQLGLYDVRWVEGTMVLGKPVLTEKFRRENKLLGIHAAMFPREGKLKKSFLRRIFPQGMRYRSRAIESAIVMKGALRKKKIPSGVFTHIWNMLCGIDDLMYYQWRNMHKPKFRYGFDTSGWSRLDDVSGFGYIDFYHVTEQSPHPDNRVVITSQKDALGARKLQQYWQWKDEDIERSVRALKVLAAQFEKAGLGKLKFELDKGVPQVMLPSIHHFMGTTRMSKSPDDGVVDENCKVHGVENLYVASSSVFPTGGYGNPTLTIIALAIRIADELANKFELANSTLNVI